MSRSLGRWMATILVALVACVGPQQGERATQAERSSEPPSQPPADRALGYLVDSAELHERARLAAEGRAPYAAAVGELLAFAEDALEAEPKPKARLKISGTDGDFVDDSTAAYGLALASVVTADRRFAEKAAEFIRSWTETTRETRDTCPDSGACNTSLVVSRHAPAFVFAADLIDEIGVLSPREFEEFRAWLRTVLLPAASERTNNWGDAGVFMQVVLTDYVGDEAGFARAIERWRSMVDLIADDGHIPEETRRGESGMLYTQGALAFKVAVATIAARRGIDLWDYEGRRGGTLREAVDYLASYWSRPQDWPFDADVNVPEVGPLWELAYARWRDPDYVPILRQDRPSSEQSHSAIRWTTLTSGVPLPGEG